MRIRRAAVAVSVAASLFAPGLAVCVADAAASRQAQIACCRAGHDMCGPHAAPAECCATTPHAGRPFTAVAKANAPQPGHAAWEASGTTRIAARMLSLWRASSVEASPPGTKRPAYLVLSILRL